MHLTRLPSNDVSLLSFPFWALYLQDKHFAGKSYFLFYSSPLYSPVLPCAPLCPPLPPCAPGPSESSLAVLVTTQGVVDVWKVQDLTRILRFYKCLGSASDLGF